MVVQVTFPGSTKAYTYAADDELRLEVGQRVEVPPSWLSHHPQPARVVAIGSSYRGPMERILRALPEPEGETR